MNKNYYTLLILAGFLILGFSGTHKTFVYENGLIPVESVHLSLEPILIEPSGPTSDTKNLKTAFNRAKGIGSGAVIQLAKGEFYLDKLDVFDFQGVLKGAGKNKTIIHPIPGGIHLPVTKPFIETNPFFIEFHGGDITLSDLSFDISEDNPVEPYEMWTGGNVTFLGAIIRISGSSIENYTANSKFQNLSFTGKYVKRFDFTPFNVDNCIVLGGGYANYPLKGNHIIQNCEFSNSETGIMAIGLSDGNLTIGGSQDNANLFMNENAGIGFLAGDHMSVKISDNKIENLQSLAGIYISQENIPAVFNKSVVPSGCNFQIANNVIELRGEAPDGIYIYDAIGLNYASEQSNLLIKITAFNFPVASRPL